MYITTELHGRGATLAPRGDIDFEGLDEFRAALAGLPDTVVEVVWDLRAVTFMDIAGLHLLSTPTTPVQVSLTNLPPQAVRLLETAIDIFPEQGWDRHLPTPVDPEPARTAA